MTREEAIEQLKWYFECDDGMAAEPITKQAYKKAIEALQQPEQQVTEIPTEKQIAYATYLAQRMCVELPKEITKEAYSTFISKWKPAVAQEDKAMNEWNEWPLRYC